MPIKLSGELVREARRSAKRFRRSLTGQIEHWATLGRVIEAQMSGEAVAQLLDRVGDTMKIAQVQEAEQRREVAAILSEFLAQPPKATEHSWLDQLRARGAPPYGTGSASPAKIVRRDPANARPR